MNIKPEHNEQQAMLDIHKLFLEALRHREQEIFRYLAILVPALGGFFWLTTQNVNDRVFISGTAGVVGLLLLGSIYSLSLGYNYRCICLALFKLQKRLGIQETMLAKWPKTYDEFIRKYGSWLTPPEMIKVFWYGFLGGIVLVTTTACIVKSDKWMILVIIIGILSFVISCHLPIHFGHKFKNYVEAEIKEDPNIQRGMIQNHKQ